MRKILVLLFCVGFLAVACATAPVKLQPVAGAPKVELNKYDTLIVEVSKAEALEMSKEDLEGMGTLITQAIRKHCPRFKQVLTDNEPNNRDNLLLLEVRFTEFTQPGPAVIIGIGHLIRTSGEILLSDSGGGLIMKGVLSKHLGSILLGGEGLSGPFDFTRIFSPLSLVRKRFAEGVAKGLVF